MTIRTWRYWWIGLGVALLVSDAVIARWHMNHPCAVEMGRPCLADGWSYRTRRLLSIPARALSPSFSYCYRCKMPWTVVSGHSTMYADGRGCFPLCEFCWRALTPAEREPYYMLLMNSWGAHGDEVESLVLTAVREGK